VSCTPALVAALQQSVGILAIAKGAIRFALRFYRPVKSRYTVHTAGLVAFASWLNCITADCFSKLNCSRDSPGTGAVDGLYKRAPDVNLSADIPFPKDKEWIAYP